MNCINQYLFRIVLISIIVFLERDISYILAKSPRVVGRVHIVLSPPADTISHGKYAISQYSGIFTALVTLLEVR